MASTRRSLRRSNSRQPLEEIPSKKRTRQMLSDSESEVELEQTPKKARNADDGDFDWTPSQLHGPKKEDSKGVKVKIEDESEKEEELPDNVLSEYEMQIQRNIEARAKLLDSLNILQAKENLLEVSPQTTKIKKEPRGIARRPKSPPGPKIIRRSLRQRNLTPDGSDLVLPDEKDIRKSDSAEFDRPCPPPGPAPMIEYYKSSDNEDCLELLGDISNMACQRGGSKPIWSGSMTSALEVMKGMKINDDLVAKVTPQRTFSVKVHPSETKTLVLVGSKWGELGIWDVGREDQTDGAHYFNVHSRPINCLTIDPTKSEHVYSTSYDSSLRRTDLSSGIVQEIYNYGTEGRIYVSGHAHRKENCIMVAGNQGHMVHVDVRESPEKAKKHAIHDKNVKIVTAHPAREDYFASASINTVALWDMRNLKKNRPLSEVRHGKVVSGLEFSPVTGNRLVSTSGDDFIRVISCDLTSLEVTKSIPHNNFTGRWLTSFRTIFVPYREDLLVVGSLRAPRRIEVFDVDGFLRHTFSGESFTYITSVHSFHPTLPILAGSNSSGKALVFKSTVSNQ